MPKSVKQVAQLAMDLYYQDFKPSDAFLRIEHFVWLTITADSKLKQDEFKEQQLMNLRKKILHAEIEMSSENYDVVEVPIKNNSITLPQPIMSFSGDANSIGVSAVSPVGGDCAQPFIRINPDETWAACGFKDTVFWFPIKCKIEFLHLEFNCKPEKARVVYIPVLDMNGSMQDTRVFQVLTMVVNFVKGAKEGVIVDTSNDGNPNVASQAEINTYILKALQNK